MRKISISPRAEGRGLRRLQLWAVAAVDGEGEAALGERLARLVEHEAVGAVMIDDLRKRKSISFMLFVSHSLSEQDAFSSIGHIYIYWSNRA